MLPDTICILRCYFACCRHISVVASIIKMRRFRRLGLGLKAYQNYPDLRPQDPVENNIRIYF